VPQRLGGGGIYSLTNTSWGALKLHRDLELPLDLHVRAFNVIAPRSGIAPRAVITISTKLHRDPEQPNLYTITRVYSTVNWIQNRLAIPTDGCIGCATRTFRRLKFNLWVCSLVNILNFRVIL
jgi:hypothetical protein